MADAAPRTRVAMVIDTVMPWSIGGRENRCAELFDRLPGLGLDVTVYTMKWWRERPSGPVRYRAITPRLKLYRGERRSVLQGVLFALGTIQLLFRGMDVLQADHMPYLQLFPLRLIAWIRRVELVVDWHEYWGRDYWISYMGRLGVVSSWIERAAMALPDVIVPDSEGLARILERHGVDRRRMFVVSNAVDRRGLDAAAPAEGAPELVFVGRLLAHKNAQLAVEALALLVEDLPALRLAIVGTGPERDRVERAAASLGVRDSVAFLDPFERQEDLWSLMKASRVLVFPSEREGFGLIVAESLAVGTPVVCIDAPGNEAKHLVADGVTGTVVRGESAAALAAGIRGWLGAPPDRDALAGAFWRDHAELDWDVSAARYAQLLRGAGEPLAARSATT